MRVTVPRDLAGGSLLSAHNWVKSTITRTNPGGSTNDYKLQQTNGTPISLSDLTSRTFDEVLVISGSRTNPHHDKVGNYPYPKPDWNYPSYTSNNRIGNNITKLLPKDVDSSMLERLAAQNGMFSALNTVTKLLYSQDTDPLAAQGSDPQVAAFLQSYANAQRQLQQTRRNPGRAFFGPDINEGYRGVVSPDEAVRLFASEQFGIPPRNIDNAATAQLMDRARIMRMYDLDNHQNVIDFVDDVLTPYLAVSVANANLLKAMRHLDYFETTKKALGRYTGDYDDTPQWRKLIAMLPMKAVDFYDGKDYALIAHSMFMRQSLAIAAMDDGLIEYIFDIVKHHPDNAEDARSPREIISGRPITLRSFLNIERPEDRIVWDMLVAQQGIIAETSPEEQIQFLRDLYLHEDRDANISAHVRRLPNEHRVSYQRDVAGFRPTPPPFWPKPVVLAVMDVLRSNIHNVLGQVQGHDYSAAFLGLGALGGQTFDPAETRDISYTQADSVTTKSVSTSSLMNMIGLISGDMSDIQNRFQRDVDGQENRPSSYPENEIQTGAINVRPGHSLQNSQLAIEFVVLSASNNPNFFRRQITETVINDMRTHISRLIHTAPSIRSFEDRSNNTLNLLTLFVEVEDTTRSQYNYTMTENDRAFVLFLMGEIFNIINPDELQDDDGGGGGQPPMSDNQIANILSGMQDPGSAQSTDERQMLNRIVIERYMSDFETESRERLRSGSTSPREIRELLDQLRNQANWPDWVITRINQAETGLVSSGRWLTHPDTGRPELHPPED